MRGLCHECHSRLPEMAWINGFPGIKALPEVPLGGGLPRDFTHAHPGAERGIGVAPQSVTVGWCWLGDRPSGADLAGHWAARGRLTDAGPRPGRDRCLSAPCRPVPCLYRALTVLESAADRDDV